MEGARIDELARKLMAALPDAVGGMRRDLENNFRAVLHAQLQRLDLATRDQFEVQVKLLERARTRAEALERRVAALEARLREVEAATHKSTG